MSAWRNPVLLVVALVATAAAASARGSDWIVLPKNVTTEGDVVAASYQLSGAAITDVQPPPAPNTPPTYQIGAWQRAGNRFTLIQGGSTTPAGTATDISRADGKTVVGYFYTPVPHSFYWNSEDGLVELTSPGVGGHNRTYACSADGRVLVGEGAVNGDTDRPFRYEVGKGWFELPTFGGDSLGAARDVSDNGEVICGYCQTAPGQRTAFVWTKKTGSTPISLGGSQSFGDHISADGKFVIGEAELPTSESVAYRYDVSRKRIQRLQNLSSGGATDATLISKDGGVVAGTSTDQFGNTHAFRWTAKNGTKDIGSLGLSTLPNSDSYPKCMSAKGDYIGGWAQNPAYVGLVDEREAFIWSTKHPMMYVHTALEAAFDTEYPRWRFYEVQAMSQDGRKLLIDARNPEDQDVLIYVQLPRPKAFVRGRTNAYYANLATYGTAVYGYYAYVWEPTTTAYNAYLYAYYAYLYDIEARKHVSDYYNKEKVADRYLADRRASYQAIYAAYVNAASRAGSGDPFAYETAYYASLAYSYMLADLKSL